jgi:hypothetical protein
VDGDLLELDAATLAAMRGEADAVKMPVEQFKAKLNGDYVPAIGQPRLIRKHLERQEVHEALAASIAWWGGYQRANGRTDSEIYRRFYFAFGIDMLGAQALKTPEALALAGKVNEQLGSLG